MNGSSVVAIVVAALTNSLLVGPYSSDAYGFPRATNDADFVVQLAPGAITKLMRTLGNEFELDSQIQFETITGTIRRVIAFAPIDFTIELFEKGDDSFDCERFDRRVSIRSIELSAVVWLPTAEDVVIQKLRWGRDKDLSDAADVIAVQNEVLDWDYIHLWTREHGSDVALRKILERL